MKKVILSALVSIFAPIVAWAQLNGDGFYRIQNNASSRYITIKDDIIGKINTSSTTADLTNIVTWRGFDNVKSNPASILYIEAVGSQYNLKAQGTSVYQIAGGRTYVDLISSANDTYIIAVKYSGVEVHLYDDSKSKDKGEVKQKGNDTAYQLWKILPINTSDNYIGLQPTVHAADGYYGTLFASYSFKKVSDGIKIYYINAEREGACSLKEITSDVIPAATPIIFKCDSNDPAQNMIMPVTDEASISSGNYLAGTYFASVTNKHEEYVDYDATSMRVLGVNDANEIIFTTAKSSDLDENGHIPMNTCYLRVFNDLTGDFKLVNEDEYAGIYDINADATDSKTNQGIFNLSGVKVDESKTLKPGIYIKNGKKVVIK